MNKAYSSPSSPIIRGLFANNVLLSKINGEIYLVIDELYKFIYSLKLVDESFYLDPREYSENILKHVGQEVIDIRKLPNKFSKAKQLETLELDVKVMNIEAGLKYMYFTLSKSAEKLNDLEKELSSEESEIMTHIPSSHLNIGRFYLIKYKEKFYRMLLIARNSNKMICQMIDYGDKICLKSNADDKCFYILTPKYFKYNAFSFHCQLVFGYNIEKAWTNKEKLDFFKQVKAQNLVKIQ